MYKRQVLHLRDGRYALIEMKLGSREIEEGASHLRKLKALIQEHNLKEPSFLMVITGGQFAYRREDGVQMCIRDRLWTAAYSQW